MLLAIGAQVALLGWYMPLDAIATPIPLLHIDHAYHWYQIDVASQLWREHAIVGFDPTFAAGYLAGAPHNMSAKVPAIVAIATESMLPHEVSYKAYVAVAASIAPACAVFAAHRCGARGIQLAVSGILALILWWASGLHWYHTAGMVSFVLASFLALPWAVVAARVLLSDHVRIGTLITVGAIGGLGLLMHPHFPILAGAMVLPAVAGHLLHKSAPRTLLRAVTLAGCAAAVNLPWLAAMTQAPDPGFSTAPYQKAVDLSLATRSALGVWSGDSQGAKINTALLLCATIGLWRAKTPDMRLAARNGVVAWLLLLILGSVGAAIPLIGNLQPNRWLVAAYVALLIPAAGGVSLMLAYAMESWRDRSATRLGASAIIALALLFPVVEAARELLPGKHGRYGVAPPEVKPVGKQTEWLTDWIRANTNRNARILFETSLGRVHDGAHIAGYLARSTHREFIGGPYPYLFQASAWDGHAFGSQLPLLDATRFEKYLNDYNIGWIVAHSTALKTYLSRIESAKLAATHGSLQIYLIANPPGFFLEGSGRIETSTMNTLVIADLSPGRVVLSYHFVDGIRSLTNGANVQAVYRDGFERPFIAIDTSTNERVTLVY